ncbi:MAG: tetratricopeptide repeat protein, partial [Bacteroidetes bacterium]|nr:tetratricopeptide repeat protein [Bacteroidota bacterium]
MIDDGMDAGLPVFGAGYWPMLDIAALKKSLLPPSARKKNLMSYFNKFYNNFTTMIHRKKSLLIISIFQMICLALIWSRSVSLANQHRIDSLLTALETAKDSNIVITFNALCLEYKYKPDIALKYGRQALNFARDIGFKRGVPNSLRNMGIVYQNQGNYKKAIEYYLESLEISETLGNKMAVALCLNNIGSAYDDQGDLEKAMNYYQRSLKIKEELAGKDSTVSYKRAIASSLKNIGVLQTQKGDYEKAIEFTKKRLVIAKEIGEKEAIKEAYRNLSETYSIMAEHAATHRKRGDYLKEAYEYYLLYSELQEYTLEVVNAAKIAKMQARMDAEKKQKKIELLTKESEIQKLRIYGLAAVVLLVLVIAFLSIRQEVFRAKHKNIELEQKLLRSQMNPHFIFNSLTSIQSFIYKHNSAEAGKYLSSFARLMRLILENSRQEYVSLEKEITTLDHYLTLQKLRFVNKFTYAIDVDPNIDIETMAIPPMLAQPFIENALEHGIRNKILSPPLT